VYKKRGHLIDQANRDGGAIVTRRSLLLIPLLAIAIGSTCATGPEVQTALDLPEPRAQAFTDPEATAVRRVIERRCAVCHACYDAPCQLVLSSREGLTRGASKDAVYDSARLRAATPTRLGLDAHTAEEWRDLGFFSVSTGGKDGLPSALLAMLALGAAHRFTPDEPLPADFPLDRDRALSCPRVDDVPAYVREHPMGGMPYGMARLSDEEYRIIAEWAASDAPTRAPPPLPDDLIRELADWETLLNDPALEARVAARYAYEHWAFAHFYVPSHPTGPFFEIVRSRTPSPDPIDVIATRFPYDDPGVSRFWYRLRRIDGVILHKTHITYRLGPERLVRYRELFLAGDWKAARFPGWEAKEASNPFVAFAEIPARSRYRFFLDDPLYFVQTFIRGPVCHGSAATDVINDRFFVAFLDPDHDLSVVDPTLLRDAKQYLRLPAEGGENLVRSWFKYDRSQKRWRDRRAEGYRRWLAGRAPDLSFIWDGEGRHPGALLTVFRHRDNAMVLDGWWGVDPKTVWVMDYPVFERIYYDLVAGFDVFGNVGHQLGVRLYMDNLRMESEDLFLVLLPESMREKIRASWYIGATQQLKYTLVNKLRSRGIASGVQYRTEDPKAELIELLRERASAVAGPPDRINRCSGSDCDRAGASPVEHRADRAFRRLSAAKGRFAQNLPEVSLVRVGGSAGAAYTLVHDREHTNVAAIFREEARLAPDEDRITILPGIAGSYPNFVFDVAVDEVEEFVAALLAMASPEDLTAAASRWGVRRTSPRFWATLDWFQDRLALEDRREAGVLDWNRYQNL
jgi:hypothetical protein